jgi:hypothetical protein
MAMLELSLAKDGRPIGEIGNRVEAVDRKTGVAVDNDMFCGGRTDRPSECNGTHYSQCGGKAACRRRLPCVPLSGHSVADPVAIRLRWRRKARIPA